MSENIRPDSDWDRIAPEDAGFDARRLARAQEWMEARAGERGYRVIIVRGGCVAAEWIRVVDADKRLPIASAAKSVYSNLLGVALAEGKLPSPDARVVDVYPEMMDVREGRGPKPGRRAFEKDRAITFRQLISNTSGYMKPGEEPGRVFHYQTFGMNVLTHALAKLYGLYDVSDPEGSPGAAALIEEKIAGPLGARWEYALTNFEHPPGARVEVFGYYTQVRTTALDLARAAWMWRCGGEWRGRRIVPEAWMRESVRTNPDVAAHCPEEEWKYGYGFWVNDHGKLWPGLPRDGFTASGAGGHYASVFPSLDLVVVQNPGPYHKDGQGSAARGNPDFLSLVIDAIRS